MVKLEGMFGSFGPTKLLPVQLGGLCGRLLNFFKYPLGRLFEIWNFSLTHGINLSEFFRFLGLIGYQ